MLWPFGLRHRFFVRYCWTHGLNPESNGAEWTHEEIDDAERWMVEAQRREERGNRAEEGGRG